ncbi:MAG TPA: copper resistance protein CopC [Nitrososphaera sp.]|nr:copper resistance protein CopC [Nitrososphaera sp.]
MRLSSVAVIAVVAVTFLTFASGIQQSFAHPVYVDSTPRAFESVSSSPSEVRVFFSEAIELSYSSIRVLGPDGNRVDMNDPHNVEGDTASIATTLQPNLPEGEYTVTTRVLSAVDGHIVEETFIFGIGVQTTSEAQRAPLLGLEYSFSRFPGMVGQTMVVGAAFATLWLWKPFSRVPWLGKAILHTRVSIDRNMMRLILIGTGIVLASGVAMIIVQAISIDAGITEAVATKFGNVWVTRMLQSSILMGIAVAVYRKVTRGNATAGRAEMYAILILGLAVLVTSSLMAHAAATNQIFPVILDFFHNAAASIWIGGLILLGFVAVPKILSIGEERVRAAALSILIPRFSTVVVTLLGIAVITGPILLFALESDLSLTVASLYGRILMVKLGLAGAMVAMGAYSQFVVQRRAAVAMAAAAGGETKTRVTGLKHYGKALKTEALVGIALLFTVSLMANGALPAGQFQGYTRQLDAQSAFAEQPQTDFSRTLYATDGKIQLSISPFAVGQNSFRLSFFNLDGSNATGINSATIKLTQVERGIGPITVETSRQAGNVFTANAAFSLPGMWHIEVEGLNTEGSNMLATINTNVKPLVSDLEFQVENYTTPVNSFPYYPIFDAARQSIWVGDQQPLSARIWQFDITTNNYTMHSINGSDFITSMALDAEGIIWFVEPRPFGSDVGIIGMYNPENKSSTRISLPVSGIVSGLAIDRNGNLWMPLVVPAGSDQVIKFDPATHQFSSYAIPTPDGRPAGITTDREGNLWFAEIDSGRIAKIDPDTGNITEYAPRGRLALEEPTAVFADPGSFNIYIADHGANKIVVFNSLLESFHEFPSVNESGLPFGMAMDSYGNLWFAQHTIDRLGVIDPRTGLGAEARIPISGSTIQWITADDRGKIWFAAQRGSALGSVTITPKPATAPAAPAEEGQEEEMPAGGIQQLGFTFSDLAGPAIAAGIAISALTYSKSTIDLKRNIRKAMLLDGS